MLFIHSAGIDTGSLVTYWERQEKMAKTEVIAASALQKDRQFGNDQTPHAAFTSPQKKEKASFLGMSMKEEKGPNGGNHNFQREVQVLKCGIFNSVQMYSQYSYSD